MRAAEKGAEVVTHSQAGRSPNNKYGSPGRSTAAGQHIIEAHVPRLVAACDDDARKFGCNAVVVGKTVIVNAGCGTLKAGLEKLGHAVAMVELDEFIKSGGSAKCLTLRLDGEEAASWATKQK